MKIVAIMPVRNEAWVLGMTARAVLMWADQLIILNHASTDNTREICVQLVREHDERVSYFEDASPVWEEMRHRQMLLDAARRAKATHIAMIDADEIVTGNLLPVIRDMYAATPAGSVLQIPWLALRGSIGAVHQTGVWADGQNASIGFVDSPECHWSSAGRGTYDFHHRHPMGRACIPHYGIFGRNGGLMHLQFISERRLRAKQALYKMTEVLRWPDREPVSVVDERYNLAVYGRPNDPPATNLHPATVESWWGAYSDLMKYFRPDFAPWQEKEAYALIREHGTARFDGLDLFGVTPFDTIAMRA